MIPNESIFFQEWKKDQEKISELMNEMCRLSEQIGYWKEGVRLAEQQPGCSIMGKTHLVKESRTEPVYDILDLFNQASKAI